MKVLIEKAEPAYRRIQSAIRERIEAGTLNPGDMVESERELARIYSVSLMTARHALTDLAREGVVERRHGAGTFVAPPKIHFNKLLGYTEQMASVGLTAHSRVLSAGIVKGEHEIAARLGLPHGAALVHIERVRFAGNDPIAHESCYLSAEEFRGLLDVSLDRVSLFTVLQQNYGVELAYSDEEIDATDAGHDLAVLLHVERDAALLRIHQLIFSTSGRPVLYVRGLYRSGRHTVRIRRFR